MHSKVAEALRVGLLFAAGCAALPGSGCARDIPPLSVPVAGDEATLARGRYLAESGMACVVCHSPRDWTRLGGPVLEGKEFSGDPALSKQSGFPEVFSFGGSDLTPHALGAWSDGEVARAVLLGQRRDRHGLFSFMPYKVWRDVVALDDVGAVVAYLRTLPPAGEAMPERKFPMPGFVLDRGPEPRSPRATAPAAGDADYGAYVTARAACVDCHTQVDERGKKVGPPFAGGRAFPLVAPGKGVVRSTNLTPDEKTGLGAWTRQKFIERFKASTLALARATPVDATGDQTPMPWWAYSGLSAEDLGAIYDHLRTLAPVDHAVVRHTPGP